MRPRTAASSHRRVLIPHVGPSIRTILLRDEPALPGARTPTTRTTGSSVHGRLRRSWRSVIKPQKKKVFEWVQETCRGAVVGGASTRAASARTFRFISDGPYSKPSVSSAVAELPGRRDVHGHVLASMTRSATADVTDGPGADGIRSRTEAVIDPPSSCRGTARRAAPSPGSADGGFGSRLPLRTTDRRQSRPLERFTSGARSSAEPPAARGGSPDHAFVSFRRARPPYFVLERVELL